MPNNAKAVIEALHAYGEAARWDYSELDGKKIEMDMWEIADVVGSNLSYTTEELLESLGIVKTEHGYEWG